MFTEREDTGLHFGYEGTHKVDCDKVSWKRATSRRSSSNADDLLRLTEKLSRKMAEHDEKLRELQSVLSDTGRHG